MTAPYSPLTKKNLGRSIASALLTGPLFELPPPRFSGAGIYVLYYSGDHPAYTPIADRNRAHEGTAPIYVGQALGKGARKGGVGLDLPSGPVLHARLAKHARSIAGTQNLRLGDFRCRYLILEDVWIPLGESYLIQQYSPVWNRLLDGFGNNAPGKGRTAGRRSAWDTFHSGRSQAVEAADHTRSVEEMTRQIADFFSSGTIPEPADDVIGEEGER